MSRWGRGRGGSVAVPLDSALFRENSNCPSAARSAGTVGKWGITSFTSIRSAPYAYTSNILKKPVQDQNSPLTVPAVETEQPPPKPKKFFKSRNAEVFPPVPQITYAPPVTDAPSSPEHASHSKEKKPTKRSRAYNRDSSSPELPRRNSEKSKAKKSTVATKASRKEEVPTDNTQPPNKRYLVRNRDKVINYAEDGSNSPIPEFIRYESIQSSKVTPVASPKVSSPKASPLVSSPSVIKTQEKIEVTSPSTSKDVSEERKPPPIVLRISKGTSRIVSTDSNEGFTSPGSDRHSSMDTHSDIGSDNKKSPIVETICSPKHEGLKITIKCAGLTQETKKEKKKDKKEHKSHKRHHKNSDDEPLKKPNSSPLPGTDAYDLYKTLASPSHESDKEPKHKVPSADDIETQLAKLESTGSALKSPRLEVHPNELPPEPKPPESSGRARRNRPNINYSENDDYLDVITAGYTYKHGTKTVSDIKKEGRKTRKKLEATVVSNVAPAITSPEPEQVIDKNEIPVEKNDLVDILSGGSDSGKSDTHTLKVKLHRKHKHKHNKNSSPDHDLDAVPQENNIAEPSAANEEVKIHRKHKHKQNKNSSPDHDLDAVPQENNIAEPSAAHEDVKLHRKQKHKQNKNSSPDHDLDAVPQENNIAEPSAAHEDVKLHRKQKHKQNKNSSPDHDLDAVPQENNIAEPSAAHENVKLHRKQKHKQNKNSSPDHDLDAVPQENNIAEPSAAHENVKLHRKHKHKQNKNSSPDHDLDAVPQDNNIAEPSAAHEDVKLHRKHKHKQNKNSSPDHDLDAVPQDNNIAEPSAAHEDVKLHRKHKHKQNKNSSPDHDLDAVPQENNIAEPSAAHEDVKLHKKNKHKQNKNSSPDHDLDAVPQENNIAEPSAAHEDVKLHKKHKHKQNKNSSPDHDLDAVPQENSIAEPSAAHEEMSKEKDAAEVAQEVANDTPNYAQANTHSSDSAYNSCPNENYEEETPKTSQDDVFKSPRVCDNEDNLQNEDKPSVKLVITKKKGSIFKSKSLVNDNPSPLPARKRRHLYKHAWANEKGNETPRPEEATETSEPSNQAGEVSEELTRVTRYRSPDPIVGDPESAEAMRAYTSVRCAKDAKEYYTVVRNVKKAHQIQEIGEFQEFNDDVEYLLDSLQNNNPISTRCLSAITLASKCTAPAFRMHLRAHGTVQKFFSALHDATNDQSLGLCTATVMFVLSQDRLNMDLDRESLELMLNLLESDASHKNALDDCGLTSAQLTKTQERVRELCAEIKSQGKAQHLDLENITVGHLAMETLLSLTSKRAGEWFKEELRVLGGVDHIVRTIQDCATKLDSPVDAWTSTHVEVLRKADRCLRVLENVTQQNEDNQIYLCGAGAGGGGGGAVGAGGAGGAARTVCRLLRAWCGAAREHAPLRAVLLDAALPALKVLLNLSHSFNNTTSLGAQVIGEEPSVMETCLIILNNQGNFIPDNRNFEFSVCVLLLLINLVQNNETNTQRLLNVRIRIDNEDDIISRSVSALDLIVDLFYKREDLARRAEENTDALLDGKPGENDKKSQDDIDETVAKLLARAGAHMEHSMVGAYVALLLGHVARARAADVRARVPTYAPLLPTLRKYYAFLALTASAEAAIVAHVKATQKIIEFMEASDVEQQASSAYNNPPDDLPQDMSLNNMTNYSNYSNTSSDRSMELDGYQ